MGGGGHWEVISAHYLLPIHIQSRLKVKIGQSVIGSNMDHYHFSNLCKVIFARIHTKSYSKLKLGKVRIDSNIYQIHSSRFLEVISDVCSIIIYLC